MTVARVADALLLDDLRKAALDRLVRCVDLASAASLLGVARDLTGRPPAAGLPRGDRS